MKRVPEVVIVGRMNVGKSTLFNRLSSEVKSITFDYAGVTRDILRDTMSWQGRTFDIIDTGGLTFRRNRLSPLQEKVQEKARGAVQSADLILLMVDGVAGMLPEDREILRSIQELKKPTILVVNKVDVHVAQETMYEFQSAGTVMVQISAEHGKGVGDLLDQIVLALPAWGGKEEVEAEYRVMLLGRPNVGKSSLMNELVEYERSIVFDEPGTTREPVSERLCISKEHLILTDTPGLRRKSAVHEDLEKHMVHSALQALSDTDIVLLVIDGSMGDVVDQELKLGFYAFTERYKALILIINKFDLMTEDEKKSLNEILERYPQLINKVPLVTISCLTHKNVGKVLPLVKKVWERHRHEFTGEELYSLFVKALERKPLIRNRQKLVVKHVQQLAKAPITIGLKVNEPAWFGASQLAFFENLMRAEYDLVGAPIKFIARKKLTRD